MFCVSVLVGVSWCWCTDVVFMQPGGKVNSASVKLLVTFAFQCTTRAQEHRAAVTQDSGLHTRHVASQQTRPQFCRLQIIESHSGMRLSETSGDVKSLMSCGYQQSDALYKKVLKSTLFMERLNLVIELKSTILIKFIDRQIIPSITRSQKNDKQMLL